MELNPNGMKRLLAAVLDSQLEPEQSPQLERDRLRQSLTTGPPLSKEERHSLWLSPLSRDDYLRLKRQLNTELRSRWRERGFKPQLVARAAAADSEELRYDSTDNSFQVTLMRQPDDDMPWMVLLILSPALRETLYPITQVRLIDSGGLEWVRGRPDKRGEISFGWYDLDHQPDQRLGEHTLMLEIV